MHLPLNRTATEGTTMSRQTAAVAAHSSAPTPPKRTLPNPVLIIGLLALAAVIGVGLYTSQIKQGVTDVKAPAFTLPTTDGRTVSLADYRGRNVLLYFSEGAECQACLVQMAQIEAMQSQFKAANIVVLPIVMNSKADILADMLANGVKTPFLLDKGTVSTAYKTIGRGMHPGLPGHSFVAIDSRGRQRWHGEFPSMWLAPKDLLAKAKSVLGL